MAELTFYRRVYGQQVVATRFVDPFSMPMASFPRVSVAPPPSGLAHGQGRLLPPAVSGVSAPGLASAPSGVPAPGLASAPSGVSAPGLVSAAPAASSPVPVASAPAVASSGLAVSSASVGDVPAGAPLPAAASLPAADAPRSAQQLLDCGPPSPSASPLRDPAGSSAPLTGGPRGFFAGHGGAGVTQPRPWLRLLNQAQFKWDGVVGSLAQFRRELDVHLIGSGITEGEIGLAAAKCLSGGALHHFSAAVERHPGVAADFRSGILSWGQFEGIMQEGAFGIAASSLQLFNYLDQETRPQTVAQTFSSAHNFIHFIQDLFSKFRCPIADQVKIYFVWRALSRTLQTDLAVQSDGTEWSSFQQFCSFLLSRQHTRDDWHLPAVPSRQLGPLPGAMVGYAPAVRAGAGPLVGGVSELPRPRLRRGTPGSGRGSQ